MATEEEIPLVKKIEKYIGRRPLKEQDILVEILLEVSDIVTESTWAKAARHNYGVTEVDAKEKISNGLSAYLTQISGRHLQKIVEKTEKLVCKGINTNAADVKLESAIDYLFKHSNFVPESSIPRIKRLFQQVSKIDKLTSFAYRFYSGLGENKFPFSEEVLSGAVHTEPEDVCRSTSLKYYVAVACGNVGIPAGVIDDLLQHIPNLGVPSYVSTIQKIGKSQRFKKNTIPYKLKEALLSVASNEPFKQTRSKALCAIVYFGIKEAVPNLRLSLKKYIEKEKLTLDLLDELTTIATALKYLTGDKQYGELVDYVTPKLKDTPYQQEFIYELNTRIKKL